MRIKFQFATPILSTYYVLARGDLMGRQNLIGSYYNVFTKNDKKQDISATSKNIK